MKEGPILFTPENAQKSHVGTKTETRRIVKPQPPMDCEYIINGAQSHALCRSIKDPNVWVHPTGKSVDHRLACPYGRPGDRLWIRESIYRIEPHPSVGEEYRLPEGTPTGDLLAYWKRRIVYAAEAKGGVDGRKFPSLHMPRWACRTVVELTAVRVERLQEITADGIRAEGVRAVWPELDESESAGGQYVTEALLLRSGWIKLWESINGPGSWEQNPWVWVLTYKRIDGEKGTGG